MGNDISPEKKVDNMISGKKHEKDFQHGMKEEKKKKKGRGQILSSSESRNKEVT